MNWVTCKKLIWGVLIIALLANVPAIAAMQGEGERPAGQYQQQKEQPAREMKGMKETGMMGQMAPLHRADEMIGKEVQTAKGEDAGEIADLLVDTYTNKVCHVILSFEGKQYPVPRHAFKMHKDEDTCVLNISREQLMKAPSYDSIKPSDADKAEWGQRVNDYYRDIVPKEASMYKGEEYMKQAGEKEGAMKQAGEREGQEWMERAGEMEGEGKMTPGRSYPGRAALMSKIIGVDVQDTARNDLGEIEDVLIDSRTGVLAYALVSYGGVVGIAQKMAAVPWAAIDLQRNLEYATLDADQNALDQAVVTDEDIARLNQPSYARRFYDTFGQEPYWEVYGFVPGIEVGSYAAWQPDSAYNKKFDAQAIQTIEGTITNVSSFRPEKGAASGLKLKVETRDGQTMLVHAGPRRYMTQQDLKFNPGSDVTVKGSKVQIGERAVIIATEVTSDGKTLKLRDETGKPLWKLESTRPQQRPESTPARPEERKGTY